MRLLAAWAEAWPGFALLRQSQRRMRGTVYAAPGMSRIPAAAKGDAK
jgi:hypothetical protein